MDKKVKEVLIVCWSGIVLSMIGGWFSGLDNVCLSNAGSMLCLFTFLAVVLIVIQINIKD